MKEIVKKRIAIGFASTCLAIALVLIAIFYWSGGSGGSVANEDIQLLCKNPQCEYKFTISREEFFKKVSVGPGLPTPVFTCPKCGQESAYAVTTCEKCGDTFNFNFQSPDGFPDRCPKCSFSRQEENVKDANK